MWVKKQQLELDTEQWTGSKLGKECNKAVYCHNDHLNSYAKYTMQNARLDELQAEIKTAGRNINNLIYTDDTTLMAESEEELKSLVIEDERREKQTGLKFNNQRAKIMASGAIQFSSTQFSRSVMSDSLRL